MKPRYRNLLIALVLITLWFGLYHFFGDLLTFEALKAKQQAWAEIHHDNTVATLALYFIVYVIATAISLPGAVILTLAGGALFGFTTGLLLVSFASTIGATCAFLLARTLFRDTVQKQFGQQLQRLNDGVKRDGALYLFTLRLVPIFPFFVINLLMGLTPMRTITFYWVSQIGMLAGTAVYVNAGTQLGQLDSLQGILSPTLLLSFALIGVLPLFARRIAALVQAKRAYAAYPHPKTFDYDLVVIGAGAAGLVSAYIGAALKAKVLLVEREKMGGDCLNTGCVPSKSLLHAAKVRHTLRHSADIGIASPEMAVDFPAVMRSVKQAIAHIEPHDSVARYSALGVECIAGKAHIDSPFTVDVAGKKVTTRNIIIASGAAPVLPNIPGLRDVPHYTSDTIWGITALPPKLIVLGGGPIGCELAQAFARLGSEVTIIQRNRQLLPREDDDVATLIQQIFEREGIRVLTAHTALEVRPHAGGDGIHHFLIQSADGEAITIPCDAVLIALGRQPRTQGFGLEELGITTTPAGTLAVDAYLRTKYPNILACGDVAGPYQFTHTASHQAWYAAVNALIRPLHQFAADYRVIPWCTFTDPEVARVGLSEAEATAQGIAFEVTRYGIDDLDRAIADNCAEGFVKVLTVPGKDTILGVTIIGPRAGDIIAEWVLAMKHKLGLNTVLGTIHIYPTYAEANRFAAGNWKKSHAPQGILRAVERWHAWRRG
ncbi:FAD-dependent oxidoreductase [Chrysiogenes arsenatis]|uniref:FAD-dependent oxidoreductase n=1 Tax=Chrysiogenes arsenatis TaxID=309797 RepID=UPI00041D9917|nr:bifunctional TVP38/TMEM64 family protein/FAD-dependent oxidoreductase [Chrysiogenes arsenatis]